MVKILNSTLRSGRGWLLLVMLLASGCAGQPEKPAEQPKPAVPGKQQQSSSNSKDNLIGTGNYRASTVTGDYAGYPALNQFIQQMVAQHGFQREYLYGLFSEAKRKQWTLDYLARSDQGMKSKPGKGSWTRYRAQFLDDRHISGGRAFWQKHQAALQRASQQYGVPPEYILGIIGVETGFGANFGNHRVLDALTTLGFDYQRRGEFFRSELENFLVMTAAENIDPARPLGSFAGAMGLGQFMPSSFLKWAVDFNGDGRKDLWNPEDAIGSVANYFAQHGWQSGQAVVTATRGSLHAVENLEPGIESQYTLNTLNQAGIEPIGQCDAQSPLRLLLLRHQQHDEYLLGHQNFYTITRYNHSTHYAMAVHELAQAIKSSYLDKTSS